MIADILGYFAGFLCAITMIPQLYKIINTKKSDDISLEFLYIGSISSVTWIFYGIVKIDYPIMICDTIILILQIISIYYTKKYRKKKLKIDDGEIQNDDVDCVSGREINDLVCEERI